MSLPILSPEASDRSINEERRASPRYAVRLRARWHPFPPTEAGTQTAQVRDISTLGIGLSLGQRLELSTFLDIELLGVDGLTMRFLQARVVHVEMERIDQWSIGCAFVSELTPTELSVFHADAVTPGGPDNRRWSRFPCNVETVCYTAETAPGERHGGRILNVSAGGVGLLLRCKFNQGTLLCFELPDVPGKPSRQILIRVVRVMEHSKGSWFLGCEFAGQLVEDELESLISL